jgi:hypothetical protein
VSRGGDERRYLRTVEAAWSKLVGRPVVVSPREFETIDAWRRRGIPVAVVLEVMAVASRRRSGSAPQALTALSRAVEEAWSAVAAGRAAPAVTAALPERAEARRAWEDALARSTASDPLYAVLSRLLEEERSGALATTLDAALDQALSSAVPDSMRVDAEETVARSLESFRRRMSPDDFRRTFDRALTDRLRTVLGLPRMTLTR